MWLQDIAIGALSSGVNNATLVVLNLSVLGCIGCLVFLLLGAASSQSWLAPHLAFLLLLAVGLWLSVNWFVIQLGTTRPEQQRSELSELLGEGSGAAVATSGESEQVTAAQAQEDDKQQ